MEIPIPYRLLEMIRGFPLAREVTPCGSTFEVSWFDYYAICPKCSTRLRVRGLSGNVDLEGLIDSVLEWIETNHADEVVRKRRAEIREGVEREDDDPPPPVRP